MTQPITANMAKHQALQAWGEETMRRTRETDAKRANKATADKLQPLAQDAFKVGQHGSHHRRELLASAFTTEPTPKGIGGGPEQTADKVRAAFEHGFGQDQPPQQAVSTAQERPEPAPAPPVDPSPQARRAEPQEPQQAADPAALPQTTAALFADLEAKLQTITTPPLVPDHVAVRRAWRELPESEREAVATRVEAEDFNLPGYLQQYGPDYRAALIGDALARRLADARKLQPDFTISDLISAMNGTGK